MNGSGVVPAIDVTVDGRPLPAELTARLVSLRVAARLGRPTQGEFGFATAGGVAAEFDAVPIGATVRIDLAGQPDPLFDGEVTCVELAHGPDGEAILRVRGYDLLHRLRKRQQLRVFEAVTVAGLATALTADLDLAVAADDPGPEYDRILQHRQNDLELLTEIAGRAGLHPVIDGGELRLVSLAGTDAAATSVVLGKNLHEVRIEANLDRLGDRVTAFGWHAQHAESFREQAGTPRAEPMIGCTPRLADVGVDGDRFLVDQPGRSADQLAGLAQGDLDRAAAGAVIIDGVADGDCRIRPGRRVEVDGVTDSCCGSYVVVEAVHTVDATGFRTAFGTRPPEPPPRTYPTMITIGLVTAVDDPDGCGRVRLSLPAYGELDAGWLAVAYPAAGAGKGIVAVPDVDDTVLVALPHGEPAAGIVLGGLYGSASPPESGVVDGRVRRWSTRTPEGLSIMLDDAGRRLRLADPAGSFVELRPELVRVHAEAADLVIEAPGRTITVRANAIDFQQATGTGDAYPVEEEDPR